ncbi:MAG: type II toxin-antitoxin system RelE/ParE family toxin [Anaeromyxobacteraceae bacterium]
MKISWTSKAVGDLARLHEFLAPVNRRAAARVLQSLTSVASRLPGRPRIGERLEQYDPREVRRVLVGKYELRYEVRASNIFILRVWHTREER